jgi:hypothetical protein
MIFLNEDTRARIAVIGDEIAYYLQNYNTEPLEDLIDVDMSMRLMFKRLSTQKTYEEIDYIVISIGSREYYSNIMEVSSLCNLIKEIFPNSSYYVVEGFLVSNDLPFINEKDVEEIEKKRVLFYDEFEANEFQLIGTGQVMSYEPLNNTNTKLLKVMDFVSELKFKNKLSDSKKQNKLGGDPFVKNVDISGEDKEDFSTIYDFLDRFEEIVDSKNIYMKDNSSRYNPDVHQIEIALAFLMSQYEDYIQYEGIFDDETEYMVKLYQKKKGLKQTGIADNETIEDILYDLKIKGFDDDDLGSYLGRKGVEVKLDCPRFKGTLDSVWTMFVNKVIDNFEGGYWNWWQCKNHAWDDMYLKSGETMFGIDRKAGQWDKTSEGRDYFGVIDNEKAKYETIEEFCKVWYHGYMGGSLESLMRDRAGKLMRKSFNDYATYLSDEAYEKVMQDKRLIFHFTYACWNGSGYFQDFAKDINNAVSSGLDCDELVDVAIESRNNAFAGTDWADGNNKVINILKNDSDLKN